MWAVVLTLLAACGAANQQDGAASGTFAIAGRYAPYHPSGELSECKDGRSVDVFQEGKSGDTGALLASSPLTPKAYDSSTQSCVYDWAVTLPVQQGRYGIALEYSTARGVIRPSLWLSKAQIENVTSRSGGVFLLSL
jgi:hypothetical protein